MRILKTIGIAALVLLGIVFASNFMRGFTAAPAPAPTPVLSSLALLDLKASAVDVAYDDLARSTLPARARTSPWQARWRR